MLTIVPAWLLGGWVTRLSEEHSWAMVAGSGVAITMTLITLRIAAIRTELDADVQACHLATRMAHRVPDVPKSYQDACNTLANALLRITVESPSARRASWLHPGVAQRLANMRSHAVPPPLFRRATHQRRQNGPSYTKPDQPKAEIKYTRDFSPENLAGNG